MSTARAFRLGATVLVTGLLTRGCFDSDQVVVTAGSSSTTSASTTGSATTAVPTTTGASSTGEPALETCRDTVACATACLFTMSGGGASQIDLIFTCLLECEPSSVPEAIDVFNLIECVTQDCIDRKQCDILLPEENTSSSGGESSSSDGGNSSSSDSGGSSSSGSSSSSSDGGSSSGGPSVNPTEQCLTCLLGGLGTPDSTLDPESGCYDEAVACM